MASDAPVDLRYRLDDYSVETWHGENRVGVVEPVSWDAGREIAKAGLCLGLTGRLVSLQRDYSEVFRPDGTIRCGSLAETTIVRVGAAS